MEKEKEDDHHAFLYKNTNNKWVLINSWLKGFSLHEWMYFVDLNKVAEHQLIVSPLINLRQFMLGFLNSWKKYALKNNDVDKHPLVEKNCDYLIHIIMMEKVKMIFQNFV